MRLSNVASVVGGIVFVLLGLSIFQHTVTHFGWSSIFFIPMGGFILMLGFATIQLGFTGKCFLDVTLK